MTTKRVLVVVAVCAIAVYVLALWNGFVGDDGLIIVNNPLVRHWSGWLPSSYGDPYWPKSFGGALYRPFPVQTYIWDWRLSGGSPAWFHAVNVLWHAGASVLVAVLAAAWVGGDEPTKRARAALAAGLVFAVHPVHVEAVANVVGRAELMAASFTLVAVYAAVERGSWRWSALTWFFGLLCKENAAVTPALIAVAWLLGLGRPRPRGAQLAGFVGSFLFAGVIYAGLRYVVLGAYAPLWSPAPVFVGQSWLTIRLTAVSAFADVARVLVFPLHLRADYSPAERNAIATLGDPAFLLGALLVIAWGFLLWLAWRKNRKVEAMGLAWIAIAFLPVANLLFPIGVFLAERTLYLPSAGLALAVGALMARAPARLGYGLAFSVVVAAAATRSVLRIPVWQDNVTYAQSIRRDSPGSYQGHMAAAGILLERGRPDLAVTAARRASEVFPLDPRPYLIGAHAAFKLGQWSSGDSLLATADRHCLPCGGIYESEMEVARSMRDSAVADSIAAHFQRSARETP